MMMKDYLKELSLTDFFILIRLECDEPFGERNSLSQLDAVDKAAIKQDSVPNERKKLRRLLKGFGMEHLWEIEEYKKEKQIRIFPPYILLFFRRILQSEMKGTLIGKISKVQNNKEKNDPEKLKKVLATITDEDIESFLTELKQDYDNWKQIYLEHYKIDYRHYEEWVERITKNSQNPEGIGETWFDLGEWYDAYQLINPQKSTLEELKGDAETLQHPKGVSTKINLDAKMRNGRRVCELLDRIASDQKVRQRSLLIDSEQQDTIPEERLEKMVKLRAEEVNMLRMLEEVNCLIKQKRTLAMIQENIHRELDEVIERVYDLTTITERQFDILVPYEIRSLEEQYDDTLKESESDLKTFINLPMSGLRKGDQAEAEQEEAMLLTNEHKIRYLKILSKRLKELCEKDKALLDKAMEEIEDEKKRIILEYTED